jgi:hypothetical protein
MTGGKPQLKEQNPQPRFVGPEVTTSPSKSDRREVAAIAVQDANRILKKIKPLLKKITKGSV